VLGDERPKTLMHIVTELDADTGAVFARNAYHTDFAGRTAFFDVDGDEPSVCGGRGDFFGEGGTRAAPAALAEPRLSGPTPPGAPGVRENGGQYTHAAVWAGLAFAKLGDAERAWELFALLAPIHHGAHAAGIATYKIEPYVVAGDVYHSRQHVGRGGWSWYTGSAGWMYQWLVESLLGLERRGNQLRVRPLLPMAWPGFESYRFGDSSIEIECREAPAGETARVSVDGVDCDDGWVAPVDDGTSRRMIVRVCRDAGPARRRSVQRNGEQDAARNDRPGSHGGQHGPPPDRQGSRVRRP
jgi:cellobiose phosphorylase